jgi:hypothetical protein
VGGTRQGPARIHKQQQHIDMLYIGDRLLREEWQAPNRAIARAAGPVGIAVWIAAQERHDCIEERGRAKAGNCHSLLALFADSMYIQFAQRR